MGFSWCANVEVVFGATVAIPRHTVRVVKRLALWQPPDGTLFEKAAKRIRDFSQIPESVRKRAKAAANPAVDYTEIPEGSELSAYDWSDVPEDFDTDTEDILDELQGGHSGMEYHPEADFELECNSPELFNKAFQLATRRLFGTEDHGLEMTFERGGAHGDIGEGASDQLMMIRVAATRIINTDGFDVARGGIGGIPWGCLATPIPTDVDMEAKRAQIDAVIKAFGFRVEKPAGWYLVTVASGG